MSEWKKVKLSDIVDIKTGKLNSNAAEKNGIYPFFTCSPEIFSINSYAFDVEAILLAGNNAEGNFHIKYYTGKFNAYQRTYVITSKSEDFELKYLFYALKICLLQFKNLSLGTSTKFLTKVILDNFLIPVPPLLEQKAIADTLSYLDEKIESNNKINQTLEEIAQAIFKSWFVDFEPFGGEEFIESELGEIPTSCSIVCLSELCEVITKGTTPTSLKRKFTESGVNFIKAESILNNHDFDFGKFSYIDEETNQILKRSIIKKDDILFTIAGTLGRFTQATEEILPANTNQAVSIIRPNKEKIPPFVLYSFFLGNWHNLYYTKRIQQAVQANLSLTTIKSLPLILPNMERLSEYSSLIEPIFTLIQNNNKENRQLTEIRNTLLPKLMSGEVRVPLGEVE